MNRFVVFFILVQIDCRRSRGRGQKVINNVETAIPNIIRHIRMKFFNVFFNVFDKFKR